MNDRYVWVGQGVELLAVSLSFLFILEPLSIKTCSQRATFLLIRIRSPVCMTHTDVCVCVCVSRHDKPIPSSASLRTLITCQII